MQNQKPKGLKRFRKMWTADLDKHFLMCRTTPTGEVRYSIFGRGERAAIILIDENDALASEVKRRMLDAGVAVISSFQEGLERGFFKII